jgi:hypothetical protein
VDAGETCFEFFGDADGGASLTVRVARPKRFDSETDAGAVLRSTRPGVDAFRAPFHPDAVLARFRPRVAVRVVPADLDLTGLLVDVLRAWLVPGRRCGDFAVDVIACARLTCAMLKASSGSNMPIACARRAASS